MYVPSLLLSNAPLCVQGAQLPQDGEGLNREGVVNYTLGTPLL